MNISERLKEIRNKKGYSVYKLAQLSEISSTYIHEIEKGKKQPTVEVLSKLCKAMDIDLSQFFSKDNDKDEDINIHEIEALAKKAQDINVPIKKILKIMEILGQDDDE